MGVHHNIPGYLCYRPALRLFIKSVQNDNPIRAAWWSMVVTFTASVAVINYTEDHLALIPALIGAFFGTYIGMRMRKDPVTD